MRQDVERDWRDSQRYMPHVTEILRSLAHHIINIEIADEEADMKRATDVVIRVTGGDIGLRARKASCGFRDFTLRSARPSGVRTELQKVRDDGYMDWFLYGWGDGIAKLTDWGFIGMASLRASGLLDDIEGSSREHRNNDGTKFVQYSLLELNQNRCLIDSSYQRAGTPLPGQRPVIPSLW